MFDLDFDCKKNRGKNLSLCQMLSLFYFDLKQKSKDFEHLLFTKSNSIRILSFPEFFSQL